MRNRSSLVLLGTAVLALGVGACGELDQSPTGPQSLVPTNDNTILRGDVGDFVWCDVNDNGLQDDGSTSGVNGVDVVIECIRDLDGTLWTMTFTTANNPATSLSGWYNFNSVPAGSCLAYVDPATIPADKKLSDRACGGPLEFYIGAGPSGNNNKNIDFCLVQDGPPPLPGSIGDFVWCDLNQDGVQDAGEPGIPGIVVNLSCADGSSASTTTDADGHYLFSNVASGVLCTVSVDPASFPPDKTPGPECSTTHEVTLGEEETNLDQDFCLVEIPPPAPGAIGDFVWCDLDDDGVQDAGEPGISGIVVNLSCEDGSSATTVTDADGYYLFSNVTSGVLCTVSIDPLSFPPDKSACTKCPLTLNVTLEEGETNLEQDFCLVDISPPDLGAIGDFVWCDLDNDGVQDAGEPGISGIVVNLSCADGSSATTVTDADGYYLFSDVTWGVLCTVSIDPASFPPDKVPCTRCPLTLHVTLAEGETNLDQDFCLVDISSPAEGCTPGYWKNHSASWPATGFSETQSVSSVFSQASAFPTLASATLQEALAFGGGSGSLGGAKILLRASVAALLNSASPGVDFPHSSADVVLDVNAALATQDRTTMLNLATSLDQDNNLGCPLN